MSLNRVIETGTYTGNGSTMTITIGWQPVFVFIASTRNSGPTSQRGAGFKLTTMTGDDWLDLSTDGVYRTVNGVTINSTGFSVGSSLQINRNNTVFHWFAVRDGPHLDTGQYIGSGSTNALVHGRQPGFMLVADQTDSDLYFNYTSQGNSIARDFKDQVGSTSSGMGFYSTGATTAFSLSTTDNVYDWIKLYDLVGSTRHIESGTYTGNGTNPRTITLGRQPKWVIVVGISADEWGWKTDTMSSADFAYLQTQYDWDTSGNGITIISTGFTVGSLFNDGLPRLYNYIVGYY